MDVGSLIPWNPPLWHGHSEDNGTSNAILRHTQCDTRLMLTSIPATAPAIIMLEAVSYPIAMQTQSPGVGAVATCGLVCSQQYNRTDQKTKSKYIEHAIVAVCQSLQIQPVSCFG